MKPGMETGTESDMNSQQSLRMNKFSEMRLSWQMWWRGRTTAQRIAPSAFVLLYWGALLALHGLRSDHLTMGIVLLVGNYGGALVNRIYRFLLPLFLTAIVY